jgi:hypothetical protein
MMLRVNGDVEDMSRPTYSNLIEGFKDEVVTISENLQALGYFKNQASLSPSEVLFLDGILTRTLPEQQWPGALSQLCKIVHKLTQGNVVILVDGYVLTHRRCIMASLARFMLRPPLISSPLQASGFFQ